MINTIERVKMILFIIFISVTRLGICKEQMPNLFLGMHFTAVDLKIVFEIFEVVRIFRAKFVFWCEEFF